MQIKAESSYILQPSNRLRHERHFVQCSNYPPVYVNFVMQIELTRKTDLIRL